ncbi:MAG TPA: sulfatase-like hydrolase/transferase [Candidatus Latescibacteria bacterium]|nr:sulfatase-like hydrolase/transferase [Candidatus Latescibacterota bacterium]HJP29681.1 sulfatase-like hydrolase/transferase [Candidatus Latescibacterota bacterium]
MKAPSAATMSRRQCLSTLGLATTAIAATPLLTGAATARQPNVILIVSDDQGSTDLGCYGATDLHTPRLDGLAADGLRFTQFYVDAPACTPSRAALLTGRHFVRCLADGVLRSEEVTIAEMLKSAGYRTACFGKWHLGHAETNDPLAQGFHEFLGFKVGAMDNYSHYFYYGGANRHVLRRNRAAHREDGTFFPDIVTREAERFIEANRDAPFFLYLPLNQPHYPLQPEQRFLEVYEHVGDVARRNYAASLTSMDEHIGRVLKHVDDLGLREDTIVMFLSDHGHSQEERAFGGGGRSTPFSGHKGTLREGGIRVPFLLSAPGRLPGGEIREQAVTSLDLLPTIAHLTGAPLPRVHVDGVNLADVLGNRTAASPHAQLNWAYGNEWVVREAHWKILGDAADDSLALYDLAQDPGETTDLASLNREITSYLIGRHNEWIRDIMQDANANGYNSPP